MVKRNLKSVSQLAEESPFTQDQLRWWIAQGESNGLNKAQAVVRIGRRVYLDTDCFEAWISAQQPAAQAGEA